MNHTSNIMKLVWQIREAEQKQHDALWQDEIKAGRRLNIQEAEVAASEADALVSTSDYSDDRPIMETVCEGRYTRWAEDVHGVYALPWTWRTR